MEKKFIAFCLIGLILFFGCTQNEPVKVADSTDLNLTYIQNATRVSAQDINFYTLARAQKDINTCELISDNFTKSKCFFEFAKDTNNINICGRITFPSIRINCEKLILDINK